MNRIFRVGDRIFKVPAGTPEESIPSIIESLSSLESPIASKQPVESPAPEKQVQSVQPPKEESGLPLNLGALSAKYESLGKGSAAIGKDSQGGASYGKYQISEAQGTLKDFLRFAKETSPDVYRALAPVQKTATNISGKFARAWKILASQGKLEGLEHEFIKNTHYDKALSDLKDKGIDLSGRPDIMKDVIWSTSVQHGGAGAADIISGIPKINSLSDAGLINRIYADRMKQFPSATPKERAAVMVRLKRERAEALDRLKREQRQKRFLTSGESNGENPRG